MIIMIFNYDLYDIVFYSIISVLAWQVIGPKLAQYTTTLGHAWLPILGQHCANAMAQYWAIEQTALGQCWVLMLAHHCRPLPTSFNFNLFHITSVQKVPRNLCVQ